MRLVIPVLPEPLHFVENRINVLIIEEPCTLRKTLKELSEQVAGLPGGFVLSVRDVPQELSRLTALLTDPLHPETASKKLSGLILKTVLDAARDHEDELCTVLAAANALAAQLSLEMRFPAAFDPLEDPAGLLRLFDFRLDSEGLDIPELLLEWMLMQRDFLGKRLFVIYGLQAFLGREELETFYRSALYEKLDLLLIEPFQRRKPMEEECVTIVDEDLCVIY